MKGYLVFPISIAVFLAGCSTPQTAEQQKEDIKKAVQEELAKERGAKAKPAESARAEAPLRKFTLDEGTPLVVRTTSGMSTKNAEAGNRFEATLEQPLVVDGQVLAKKGALAEGLVADASQGGRVKGRAYLTLSLESIRLADGRTLEVRTGSVTQVAKSGVKKDMLKTGIASGVGAAIGAIAGGGKGAAIGAGAGGAAGAGLTMATRGPAAQLPPETVVTFRLAAPVTVTEK